MSLAKAWIITYNFWTFMYMLYFFFFQQLKSLLMSVFFSRDGWMKFIIMIQKHTMQRWLTQSMCDLKEAP